MEFFDSLINDFTASCKDFDAVTYLHNTNTAWKENEYSKVILQRETACELDGTGFNMITGKTVEDGIVLIGPDLDSVSSKQKFARVCIVQLENKDDEQQLYNLIRKVEYVKYHFFPEGYMIRTASRSHKEGVRVSRSAVKDGLSFEMIGNMLIRKFKAIPSVKAVKVFFVTDPSFNYSETEAMAQKSNTITEALNHIMNSVKFDCDTCNLKPICDEVEGMKELHFKNARKEEG